MMGLTSLPTGAPNRNYADLLRISKVASTHTPFVNPAFASRQSLRCRASESSDDESPPTVMGDWRSFRMKLVAETAADSWATRSTQPNLQILQQQDPILAQEDLWAHSVGAPEQGGLLIASTEGQSMLPSEYWQTVIFLGSYSREEGAVGFMLNRPTGLVMGKTPLSGPQGRSALCDAFTSSRVYCGGLIAQQVISLMHRFKELEGSKEVVPGIYIGGQKAATEAVLAGKREAESFKFFSGCVAWGPGELEQEVANGAWHCAACSRSLVLKHCIALPIPLWAETMKLMGGSWAQEAAAVYGDET